MLIRILNSFTVNKQVLVEFWEKEGDFENKRIIMLDGKQEEIFRTKLGSGL